jgi:hypothetical protein
MRENLRDRIDETDDRVMHWISHTNTGVAVGLAVCFAFLTLAFLLLS